MADRNKQTCSFTEFDMKKTFKMNSLLVLTSCFAVAFNMDFLMSDARLQCNPVLGGRVTFFSVFLCFCLTNSFPEGKAFDTVVVARWLRFVVHREPIDDACVTC